jgi:hypothetical protein
MLEALNLPIWPCMPLNIENLRCREVSPEGRLASERSLLLERQMGRARSLRLGMLGSMASCMSVVRPSTPSRLRLVILLAKVPH